MKKFSDIIADVIIENEGDRIKNILDEVTIKIRNDFVEQIHKLVDEYYDDYTPTRYVRLYAPKRKLRSGRNSSSLKPRKGGMNSLYEVITKGGIEDPIIGVWGQSKPNTWVGGIVFDSAKMGYRTGMRHNGGISEWNIMENFLFAGEGVGVGDWRSVPESGFNGESADAAMKSFMDTYKSQLDTHYKNACNKYKN